MKETEVRSLNHGDCEYPEQVVCRRCQVEVPGPLGSRDIAETFWEISERSARPDAGGR